MRIILIINILLRILLGSMMLYGGTQKFAKPMPSPTQIIDEVRAGKSPEADLEKLKIRNYIFGLKQSGFFWQMLGALELLVGILLLAQITSLLAATLAMPLTLNIFLFHLFLEPNDTAELLQTLALLLANVWLIGVEFPRWRPLLRSRIW